MHQQPSPDFNPLMERGARLMQSGHLEKAFADFREASNTASSDEMRARANQMAGVVARLLGKLDISVMYFVRAYQLAIQTGNETLRAAILRDHGITRETLFFTTGKPEYLKGAQKHYALSVHILETLIAKRDEGTSYELESELLATQTYLAMLIWRTAKSHRLRHEANEQLHDCYTDLKLLNTSIELVAQEGNTTITPFEVYQTNALMRVVRADSVFGRIRHCAELMRLTSPSSASPGRRKQAIVALVGGDRLYRWFELRRVGR